MQPVWRDVGPTNPTVAADVTGSSRSVDFGDVVSGGFQNRESGFRLRILVILFRIGNNYPVPYKLKPQLSGSH
jgi:hypothetical protein